MYINNDNRPAGRFNFPRYSISTKTHRVDFGISRNNVLVIIIIILSSLAGSDYGELRICGACSPLYYDHLLCSIFCHLGFFLSSTRTDFSGLHLNGRFNYGPTAECIIAICNVNTLYFPRYWVALLVELAI
jgi:hypothetical protein